MRILGLVKLITLRNIKKIKGLLYEQYKQKQ